MSAAAVRSVLSLLCATAILACSAQETPKTKPLFREFMGLNGHTVQFKPQLYKQVCRVVRDYHPVEWDLGKDSDYKLDFPFARNRVNWEHVYGSWKKEGFDIDVCLMFETLKQEQWKDIPKDAHRYGMLFAQNFGPSSRALADCAEVGNEPGKFSDEKYRIMFESMAKGLRAGDPKLKIATCNVNVGKSGDYHKSVDCVKGLEELYDVLNIHSYAQLVNWPTWKRSYPEDEKLPTYLQDIEKLIEWRNANAPGKEIWLTEFGYDSSTKPAPKTGDFSKWVGNTDTEQAQWLIRSFFAFAKMDIQRAYIYFFDDKDTPQLHGASGLTRDFKPKPAFHSVAHLYRMLGDYRFSRVVIETKGELSVHEFVNGADPKKLIWAVWSPTGTQRKAEAEIALDGATLAKAELMPLTEGDVPPVTLTPADGKVKVPVEESPLYLFLTK